MTEHLTAGDTASVPRARQPQQRLAGGRLLAQRTFFASGQHAVPDELYAQVKNGIVTLERHRARLGSYTKVTTNTYFGRFPASYWQRWTEINEVELNFFAKGVGRVSLVASDSHGDPRVVDRALIDDRGDQVFRLRAPIDRFVDGGALSLLIETAGEELSVEYPRWTVYSSNEIRPFSLVICTHNRADYCLDTLETLLSDDEVVERINSVYVVDQGDDPVESRERFAYVQQVLSAKLKYIRQPNLGGSGGFTRGMYESMRSDTAANVLLMDDDIKLETETLARVSAFANCTVKPSIVGGQMLGELHPDQLLADAEGYVPEELRLGVPATDRFMRRKILKKQQEKRVNATYNGWWCCLVPRELIETTGYPMPFFFQWDDVEYGVRNRSLGNATVTLPGAAVWHSDFKWRSWDDWCRYFHIRNGLIVRALHTDISSRDMMKYLAKELFQNLVSMRYGMAATVLTAIDDYLCGPRILRDGGAEQAATIRKLRSEFPETQCVPASAVSEIPIEQLRCVQAGHEPSKPTFVLIKRAVYHWFGKYRRTASVRVEDDYWWHVSLFDRAVVTDPSQRGVRVHRADRNLMRRLTMRTGVTLWKFWRKDQTMKRQYRDEFRELTSQGNWERLFDCD